MSIGNYSNGSTTVGTTPTLICTVDPESSGVILQNTGSAAIYVGGPNVTTSGTYTGISLTNTSSPVVFFPSIGGVQHGIYGVVATGTQTISWAYCQAP